MSGSFKSKSFTCCCSLACSGVRSLARNEAANPKCAPNMTLGLGPDEDEPAADSPPGSRPICRSLRRCLFGYQLAAAAAAANPRGKRKQEQEREQEVENSQMVIVKEPTE